MENNTGEKPLGSILEEHHPEPAGRSNKPEGDTPDWQNQAVVKWELMVLGIQRFPWARLDLEKGTYSGPLGFCVPLHFSTMPEIFHGFKCFDNETLHGAKSHYKAKIRGWKYSTGWRMTAVGMLGVCVLAKNQYGNHFTVL